MSTAGLEMQYPGNGRLAQRPACYGIVYRWRKAGQNL